jgi:hypothetical protein
MCPPAFGILQITGSGPLEEVKRKIDSAFWTMIANMEFQQYKFGVV